MINVHKQGSALIYIYRQTNALISRQTDAIGQPGFFRALKTKVTGWKKAKKSPTPTTRSCITWPYTTSNHQRCLPLSSTIQACTIWATVLYMLLLHSHFRSGRDCHRRHTIFSGVSWQWTHSERKGLGDKARNNKESKYTSLSTR